VIAVAIAATVIIVLLIGACAYYISLGCPKL
jgi:hypothetical protein